MSSDTTQTQQTQSRLLTLPPELRLHIYGFVIGSQPTFRLSIIVRIMQENLQLPTVINDGVLREKSTSLMDLLALLHICKAIRHEAYDAMWDALQFDVTVAFGPRVYSPPLSYNEERCAVLQKMRKAKVSVHKKLLEVTFDRLQRFLTALTLSDNLKVVTIEFVTLPPRLLWCSVLNPTEQICTTAIHQLREKGVEAKIKHAHDNE